MSKTATYLVHAVLLYWSQQQKKKKGVEGVQPLPNNGFVAFHEVNEELGQTESLHHHLRGVGIFPSREKTISLPNGV